MTHPRIYMDIAWRNANFSGERISGDSVLCKRLMAGQRTLVVLSDGMGHGIKANILSTLTSSMLINLMQTGQSITRIAAMILRTLPVCSIRKISYSTFTLLDMDSSTGTVSIVEYDNPKTIILRGGDSLPLQWKKVEAISSEGRKQIIRATSFQAAEGDKIVLVSDGVTQSGQKNEKFRFGWGEANLHDFASYLASTHNDISPSDFAMQVISKASMNDSLAPADDMTCVVVGVRQPRDMMFISCPPALREDHARLAGYIKDFEGKKVINGYHVAEILATELGLEIEREKYSEDPSLPPAWHMNGFEQVTEGLITSNRILDSLESGQRPTGRNVADRVTRMLLDSDNIEMVIGTMRSSDNREQWQAGEFELRRGILQRIAQLLETSYEKQVTVTYI